MITDETRKAVTLTEKIRNVCIGVGALSALILGLVATFKGEPVAQKTWETLRLELNKQSLALNQLHARVVYLQAHEEGRHSAEIQLKLDALQKQYDALKAAPPVRQVEASRPTQDCTAGYIEVEGKCRRVTVAVARKVETIKKAAAQDKARLVAEKRRTEALQKKLKGLQQTQKGSFPTLRPLPQQLDDAAKE